MPIVCKFRLDFLIHFCCINTYFQSNQFNFLWLIDDIYCIDNQFFSTGRFMRKIAEHPILRHDENVKLFLTTETKVRCIDYYIYTSMLSAFPSYLLINTVDIVIVVQTCQRLPVPYHYSHYMFIVASQTKDKRTILPCPKACIVCRVRGGNIMQENYDIYVLSLWRDTSGVLYFFYLFIFVG